MTPATSGLTARGRPALMGRTKCSNIYKRTSRQWPPHTLPASPCRSSVRHVVFAATAPDERVGMSTGNFSASALDRGEIAICTCDGESQHDDGRPPSPAAARGSGRRALRMIGRVTACLSRLAWGLGRVVRGDCHVPTTAAVRSWASRSGPVPGPTESSYDSAQLLVLPD